MKLEESYLNGLKTLWEKEKLLVTSNFSFSHSVFRRLETLYQPGLVWERVNMARAGQDQIGKSVILDLHRCFTFKYFYIYKKLEPQTENVLEFDWLMKTQV